MRKTKIVCTIGPASESKEMLTKLVQAGMNVMRLNFSHGDYAEHGARISNIREVVQDTGVKVAILLDTKGPEIRTMNVSGGDVLLEAGQTFTLSTDQSISGDNSRVAVTYPELPNDLAIGNTVLLDDGLIQLTVTEITGGDVICRVENTGELGNKKGVNLPGVSVKLPALSEKDKSDIVWGCGQDVDFIAASFIRKASDVEEIRALLIANGGANIKIISKIENQEGVDNFDAILEASDGIMVARGDLGVEIAVEEVIFAQKMMIKACILARKPVITATQMLDSMIKNPRPTRAEAGDVANAILDGTDAVMLSGESAKGKYPVETVAIMAQICERTDTAMRQIERPLPDEQGLLRVTESICKAAVHTAQDLAIKLIVVGTVQGRSVQAVRKYFPKAQILALTRDPKTAQQLCLTKGVTTSVVEQFENSDNIYAKAKEKALEKGLAVSGDAILVVAGALFDSTNTLSVQYID
ncbi:MAG: pyruvate kinase PykF [Reinekea forsetii]|uniref:Pyruvate kinase n=1 Tax=Reinekea forsetii TaxID=1336806 RepID=A0A2K8KX74_9GAMM|nr:MULTISPECIES: pyruvate kinase PykF [Reinekea]ATX77236.1 pyruvate kinase [Reinekea forsetii]MDO7674695.1 pyruvate kinase PykF [Reinekea forsetii]